MTTPTIPNGEQHFFPILYEGNGAAKRVGKFVPFTDNATVANSVTFNSADSADRLMATIGASSTANTRRKMTISLWYKWTGTGANYQTLWTVGGDGQVPYIAAYINNNGSRPKGSITFFDYTGSGSSYNSLIDTKRGFSDTSKWYHVLFAMDTTQSTDSDRFKIYVDGDLQETDTNNYYSQDFDTGFGTSVAYAYGTNKTVSSGSYWFNGSIAELNHVDGTALTPSTFGVTDTSTGRWIPKTITGITYGDNGHRLQFLDSTHAGIDTSGNGNTFTASGLIDIESQPIAMGGTAFDTGSAGSWDSSYPVANGFNKSTAVSDNAIYDAASTAIGGVIGWDFGSGRSANIQTIKINQIAVNNSITGFAFEYSDNGSDYTSVGTFSVTASASEQTVSVLNTAGKHRYWRLRATTDTSGGQSAYRWIVAFLGFYSQPVTTDSPTQNFVTFDQFDSGNTGTTGGAGTIVLADGNLRLTAGSNPSNWDIYRTSKPVTSGKYYLEVTLTDLDGATYLGCISKTQNIKNTTNLFYDFLYGWSYATDNGKIETNNSGQLTYGGARSEGDVIGIAVDMDNGNLWFSENGTYPNSGNPATGANPAFTNLKIANQDGGLSFACQMGYSGAIDWNFGQRSYRHTPPTGFAALQQDNMPTTDKGVSGLVWMKNRDATDNHQLYDSSRGEQKDLHPNTTDQEGTTTDGLQKFLIGGQQIEDDESINTSGESYVSWNWTANSGTTETNNEGNTTVTLQKNTTAGFSIGTFTSTVAAQTCGHGLGVKPDFILLKRLDGTQNFMAYHSSLSSSDAYYLHLNNTDATQTGSDFGNTVPTSTVFTTNVTGVASRSYCFWAWRAVDGFSKFGIYEGNNSANGTLVYTGFKPAFVMIKGIDSSSSSYPWAIYDNKRSPTNPVSLLLEANATTVENTLDRIDFLSNGFKLRQSYSYSNAGETYVYVAFAEHPFVGDGTSPVTAR